MEKIFDTHAHYTSHRFGDHRDTLLAQLPQQNVAGVLDCGTDLATTLQSLALGEGRPWLYTAAGIHPQSLIEEDASTATQFDGDWRKELAALEALYEQPKVVAVGEIGLDYHWPIPREEQKALFLAELASARNAHLPVSIHDREAHGDMYEMLRREKPQGIVHCYSGSADDARWLTAQGLYLGIGGTVTFKNARQVVETVAAVPLESLVLETDCPYLAPEPFRGKENNSALLLYVAQRIAEIKDIAVSDVLRITAQNARRVFALPESDA